MKANATFSRSAVMKTAPSGLLLILCCFLSGGGSDYAMNEAVLKLAALLVAGYYCAGFSRAIPDRTAWQPLALLALACAIPLIQLVPLPPTIWRALPGRDLASDILDALGQGSRAAPQSLDPTATLRWLTGLLPGAAMLIAVLHLRQEDRFLLLHLAVLLALASLAVAAVQSVTGGHWGVIYPSAHRGYPTGVFANRNHQAALLLLAIPMAAACAKTHAEGSLARWLIPVLSLPFAAGVLATTSRMGLILLPVSFGGAALLLLGGVRPNMKWTTIAALIVATAGMTIVLSGNRVAAYAIDRLTTGNVDRLAFWQGTVRAIAEYWPVGSGMGTFVPVFRSAEQLADISPYYPNHAHNDFLEYILEGGAPAALVVLLGLVWFGRTVFGLSKRVAAEKHSDWTAVCGILLLILHSCVDYPARILFLEALGGMFVGLLVPPPLMQRRDGATRWGRRSRRDGTRRSEPDRHIRIGNADHAAILHSINAKLPVRPAGIVIAERHGGIDDSNSVSPDPKMTGDWIGRDFPYPVDPASQGRWCGPSYHGLGRCQREPLAHRMRKNALNAAIHFHGD
ncbi:MAG: O-antigen ligase family protein, partial [Sphingobium sp.]